MHAGQAMSTSHAKSWPLQIHNNSLYIHVYSQQFGYKTCNDIKLQWTVIPWSVDIAW